MADLILPVKAIYFHQIREGSKPEEFRLDNEYWRKRLVGKTFDRVIVTLGYPKAGDTSRRVIRPWRGYVMRTITHEFFGNMPQHVFAINVSVPGAEGE
ncbi:ASCH domain-containing protein [Herbaspirillum rhizosphaerae]|uniref:ASCH domain-containing protein n=1 Tax=Herbaspirillum rhizosphaerae TaxID=346179 RepID=A0ABW8ZCF0_9BURK